MSHTTTNCKIYLDVSVKTEMPDGDQLFITGNLPELGSWDPAGLPLPRAGDDRYALSLSAPSQSVVECKLTRGTWKTQGIYDLTEVPPNNLIIKADKSRKVKVDILGWLDQQVLESDPVVGSIVEKDGWSCRGLKYKRPVQVWLPKSYDPQGVPSDVVFMHDGQNLFEPASAFAGIDWKVDETVSRLIDDGQIPPCIVVAIPNSPDRMNELNLFTQSGQAYADFIVNEIRPWVHSTFNVNSRPHHNAVMGSSMGGLMSLQMTLAFPEVFGLAGCLSSAFQKTDGEIFKQIRNWGKLPDNVRIYLDTGEYEEPIAKGYFAMMKILKAKGFIEGHNLMGFFDEGATHCEAAWARRLFLPLRFLFSRKIV